MALLRHSTTLSLFLSPSRPRPTYNPAIHGRRSPPVSAMVSAKPPPVLSPEKVEVFKSLEGWASQQLLPILKPVEESWQPQDLLPDPSQPFDVFIEEVRGLRERTAELPDDYLLVLIGDMITEEALPTYESMLNRLDGVKDDTGASPSPWATWTRGWTAEENRHGDLLRAYLYLSGRVDMRSVERTIQYLIGSGMDLGMNSNSYMFFVYASFQERATAFTHGSTGRLAKKGGDHVLAKVCGTIAGDEKRHETAYSLITEKLLEIDPTTSMLAVAEMLRINVAQPAHLMQDGRNPHIFNQYWGLTERLGIYTIDDYADNLDFFIRRWNLEKVEGLTSEGRNAQEFVCGLVPRIRRLHEVTEDRAKKIKPIPKNFSWIFDREILC